MLLSRVQVLSMPIDTTALEKLNDQVKLDPLNIIKSGTDTWTLRPIGNDAPVAFTVSGPAANFLRGVFEKIDSSQDFWADFRQPSKMLQITFLKTQRSH